MRGHIILDLYNITNILLIFDDLALLLYKAIYIIFSLYLTLSLSMK